MLVLHAHGVGTSRAVRIYKTYGAEAVATITESPYRFARDIRGIGFKTADQVAAKLGIAKDAMVRVRAGVSYALAEGMDGSTPSGTSPSACGPSRPTGHPGPP